jgi:uncharacterized protein
MKITYTVLDAMTGSSHTRRRLPFMAAHSGQEGPVVWLTAGVHGDEVGGIVVVQEVFRKLKKKPLRQGTLYAFPLLNPVGFETASRHVTISEEDLNRAFPGKEKGTLAERMAHQIFQTIVDSQPSFVLDLHNDWVQSVPYTFIDPPPRNKVGKVYRQTQQLAANTGLMVILDKTEYKGTLSYSLLRHNIPALSIELGESYVVNERNIEVGTKLIWSILARNGMTEPVEPFEFKYKNDMRGLILAYSDEPLSSSSGIVRFLVKPGDLVKKGEPIARVYDAFGHLLETLKAEHDAILLRHTDYSVAFPGTAIMSFGNIPHQPK